MNNRQKKIFVEKIIHTLEKKYGDDFTKWGNFKAIFNDELNKLPQEPLWHKGEPSHLQKELIDLVCEGISKRLRKKKNTHSKPVGLSLPEEIFLLINEKASSYNMSRSAFICYLFQYWQNNFESNSPDFTINQ